MIKKYLPIFLILVVIVLQLFQRQLIYKANENSVNLNRNTASIQKELDIYETSNIKNQSHIDELREELADAIGEHPAFYRSMSTIEEIALLQIMLLLFAGMLPFIKSKSSQKIDSNSKIDNISN